MTGVLIGVTGNAGSGKDTLVGLLREWSPRCVTLAFADGFKFFLFEAFDVSAHALWGPSSARSTRVVVDRARLRRALDHLGPVWTQSLVGERGDEFLGKVRAWADGLESAVTVRHLLTSLGTEVGRAFDPLMWTRATLRQVPGLQRDGAQHIVISDARQVNEAFAIREAGGLVWRVDNPRVPRPGPDAHNSEREVWSPEMDALVTSDLSNAGTIDELSGLIRRELDRVGRGR